MAAARPIGELLTEAGLISTGQLQTALYDQQVYQEMRLGEILASRGWIQSQTADFFSEILQHSLSLPVDLRLGDCFLNAGLLNSEQIADILEEQSLNHVRFGSMAILKGYISQKTLDFFLKYFAVEKNTDSSYLQGNRRESNPAFSQNHQETPIQKETDPIGVATLGKDHVIQPAKSGKDPDIHWI